MVRRMITKLTAGEWLEKLILRLVDDPAGLKTRPEAALEAQVLLAHALGCSRASLLAHPEQPLEDELINRLESQAARLAQGIPLPYLTGLQAFYELDFEVTPDVLIPRPETELLVEQALTWLSAHPHARRAADVGTGSGCIAASLARRVPGLNLLAVDASRPALEVARRNILRHNLSEQISLLQGDLLSAARGPLDLVCANLPYIPSATLSQLDVTRHEPRLALDGGPDGLRLIFRLLQDAPRWLAPAGLLLLEIEARQGGAAAALARAALPHARVDVLPDLAGLDRLVRVEQKLA
jgi:release factor glutamine methyltransferase